MSQQQKIISQQHETQQLPGMVIGDYEEVLGGELARGVDESILAEQGHTQATTRELGMNAIAHYRRTYFPKGDQQPSAGEQLQASQFSRLVTFESLGLSEIFSPSETGDEDYPVALSIPAIERSLFFLPVNGKNITNGVLFQDRDAERLVAKPKSKLAAITRQTTQEAQDTDLSQKEIAQKIKTRYRSVEMGMEELRSETETEVNLLSAVKALAVKDARGNKVDLLDDETAADIMRRVLDESFLKIIDTIAEKNDTPVERTEVAKASLMHMLLSERVPLTERINNWRKLSRIAHQYAQERLGVIDEAIESAGIVRILELAA